MANDSIVPENVLPSDEEEEEDETTVTIQLDEEEDLEDFVIPSPIIPTIPELSDDLILRDLHSEVLDRIALHLDNQGLIVKNWSLLAHYLEKDGVWIKNSADRAKLRGSPTIELMHSCPNTKLADFLTLIRDKLERYDVIIDILPFLRNIRHISISNRAAKTGQNSDSGVAGSLSSKPEFGPIEIFRSPHTDSDSGTESSSLRRSLKILISFYPDKRNSQLRKYVKWLQKNLEEHGACVESLSLSFYQRVATNLTEALTGCFWRADKIIVIPSVQYKYCVDSLHADEIPEVDERIQQSLKYIHSQMSAEYLKNGCRNHRFYVVALGVPNGFHPDYVPSFLNNTLLFHWPSENTSLMTQLFRGFKDLTSSSLSLASGNSMNSLSQSMSVTSDMTNHDL